MKHLWKYVALCFFITLSSLCLANTDTTFNDHIIIFGDSLSDSGNFPEPANVANPTIKNFNLYVPIANPLPTSYNTKFLSYLNASLGSANNQGLINSKKRNAYSANWPLFLGFDLHAKPIVSWVFAYTHPNTHPWNINYAWATALAGFGDNRKESQGACFNGDFTFMSSKCNAKTLLATNTQYRNNTKQNLHYDKETDYDYKKVFIPDLTAQMQLYLKDKNIALANHTDFFIYMGANDIDHTLRKNLWKALLEPSSYFRIKYINMFMYYPAHHIKQTIKKLEKAYRAYPNRQYHIYLFTIPSLTLTHEAYTEVHMKIFGYNFAYPLIARHLHAAINNSSKVLNKYLRQIAAKDAHVTIVPVDKYMNMMAFSKTFVKSFRNGEACSQESRYYKAIVANNTNCQYHQHLYYLAWNGGHFTAKTNQVLAKHIVDYLKAEH